MNINTREIRVFLSSTFRDMDAERTYLVKQVFPKVRAACLKRQVGFSEIDLRWGVSEEESKNGATVEICLKEIDRCRDFPPFFVGFLGERYGWVPKHSELAAYWEQHSDSEYAKAILNSIERGISVTELEMELAVLGQGAAKKIADHALFCLRDAKLTGQLYQTQTGKAPDHTDPAFYDAGNGKLDALKHKIRRSGFLGLDNYTTVEQFGAAVENYLLSQLDRYFPADEVPTPLQRTNAAHQAFRFHRLQNFLPRTDVREQMIQSIEQRIESPYLGPILVTGPSGQGKSALMADLARHMHNQPVNLLHPNPLPQAGEGAENVETWCVIDHYIGADNANYLDGWVDRILNTLHPDIKDITGDIPESPKDKVEALSTWISMAARRHNCRYLFILDALDQLSDGGKNLDILTPQTLGPDGIFIASAADGTLARQSTAQWQTMLEVPPLTNELKAKLIQDTLDRYRKKLPPELAAKLAQAPQSGSPLFLILALEELRVDARHETLSPTTAAILKQPDAEHLFLNHFLLDADNGRPELPELAASFMALLGASRAGLSEIELADLLAMPNDPIAEDTGKPRMPQVYLSKLLNNLAPFLLDKQGRRAPMHRIFGEVALNYYGTWPVREHLYAHFAPGYGKEETEYNGRAAAEALHQITEMAIHEHPKQKQARKQIVADLGYLPIPVKLHDDKANDGEKHVLEAINMFANQSKRRIQKEWKLFIEQMDANALVLAGDTIREFGAWLNERAQYYLALGLLEPLSKIENLLLPFDSLANAHTLNYLGLTHNNLARYDEALKSYQESILIRKRIQGDDHLDVAMIFDNLAALFAEQGNYDQAASSCRSASEIYQKTLADDHPDWAIHLNNMGQILQKQGEAEDAGVMILKALGILEKSLGPDHPDTGLVANNLGGIYFEKGDYVKAVSLIQRALDINQNKLGDHPNTATCLDNLAVILRIVGKISDAEQLGRRALALREKYCGAEHPDSAATLSNLAVLLAERGDLVGAKALCLRALAINEKSLGIDHPDTQMIIEYLAGLD